MLVTSIFVLIVSPRDLPKSRSPLSMDEQKGCEGKPKNDLESDECETSR